MEKISAGILLNEPERGRCMLVFVMEASRKSEQSDVVRVVRERCDSMRCCSVDVSASSRRLRTRKSQRCPPVFQPRFKVVSLRKANPLLVHLTRLEALQLCATVVQLNSAKIPAST